MTLNIVNNKKKNNNNSFDKEKKNNSITEDKVVKITKKPIKEIDLDYRAHVQNMGWQDWVKNGEEAGIVIQESESGKIVIQESR